MLGCTYTCSTCACSSHLPHALMHVCALQVGTQERVQAAAVAVPVPQAAAIPQMAAVPDIPAAVERYNTGDWQAEEVVAWADGIEKYGLGKWNIISQVGAGRHSDSSVHEGLASYVISISRSGHHVHRCCPLPAAGRPLWCMQDPCLAHKNNLQCCKKLYQLKPTLISGTCKLAPELQDRLRALLKVSQNWCDTKVCCLVSNSYFSGCRWHHFHHHHHHHHHNYAAHCSSCRDGWLTRQL